MSVSGRYSALYQGMVTFQQDALPISRLPPGTLSTARLQ